MMVGETAWLQHKTHVIIVPKVIKSYKKGQNKLHQHYGGFKMISHADLRVKQASVFPHLYFEYICETT